MAAGAPSRSPDCRWKSSAGRRSLQEAVIPIVREIILRSALGTQKAAFTKPLRSMRRPATHTYIRPRGRLDVQARTEVAGPSIDAGPRAKEAVQPAERIGQK